jgi:hypothetical protein
MADLSELFDYSFDLETAVIQLSTFLERLEAASPQLGISRYDGRLYFFFELGNGFHRRPAVELEKFVHDEVGPTLDAAYVTAEKAAQHFPDFPVVEFMNSLVFRLDELVKATSRKTDFPDALCAACEAISREYPKFRAQLKLLELRAKHLPEAAPESERPATGPAPTVEAEALKGLSESEKRVAEEMSMALDFLRQQSETEEHEFERPTYEVMYRALEELLADKGEKPSQTPETWRRYASKVRRHLDIPGRKRRA